MRACICKKLNTKGERVSAVLKVKDFDNGTALTPPMGWSSWNCFRGDISEKSILEIADAMVATGLKDSGYVYLNLDDCWMASERNEKGELQGEAMRFPSDMGETVKRINQRGLKAGLYASNGVRTCEDLPSSLGYEKVDTYTFARWGAEYFKYDFCNNVPYSAVAPLIVRIEIGTEGNAPLINLRAEDMCLEGSAKVMLDKNEKVGSYVSGLSANAGAIVIKDVDIPEDGEYFATVTFKKVKGKTPRFIAITVNGEYAAGMNAYCGMNNHFVRRIQTSFELKAGKNEIRFFNPVCSVADSTTLQYVNMGRLLDRAAQKVADETGKPKRPICYSVCEKSDNGYLWGAKAGNLWRTTHDILPEWSRIDKIYRKNVFLYEYAGKGHWNDPDMLEVGNGNLSDAQNKTHFALWCMMAAPLIMGNDIRKFVENGKARTIDKTLTLLTDRDLIAIDQDKKCKQAKPVKTGKTDVLVKPLESGWAICFYNRRRRAGANVKFDLNDLVGDKYLDFEKKDEYLLFDVWSKSESRTKGEIITAVPPMGTAVYIVK